ncbi:cholesterol oxidase substrate-binding domain-containing protein [Streptomyces synnematoformans]|uniref:Uncharacterized protein n=1 Tax=Streptomyces synnematoformans TaxID=415721 RepID=A0ABN2XTM3_9ACTN
MPAALGAGALGHHRLHHRKGHDHGDGEWARGVRILDRLDPHRVFSNTFLDNLLRA